MIEMFQGVEDVWVIWTISVVVFALLIRRVTLGLSWQSVSRFARSERGASYALSYVITLPLYLLVMAVLLQASLILLCKIGTVYSAYSAARTMTVWQGHGGTHLPSLYSEEDFMRYKAKRSATMAMVPFANSYHKDSRTFKALFPLYPAGVDEEKGAIGLPETFANFLTKLDRKLYVRIYDRLNEDADEVEKSQKIELSKIIKSQRSRVSDQFISNKYDYAAAATKVTFPKQLVKWNEDLDVTVRYRMAFHVPGVSRILGGKLPVWAYLTGDKIYYRDIKTTVTIPSEAAQSQDGRIGIPHKIYSPVF